MKVILFAGGTGKRFWPLSRINSPKQFLPVASDKPLLRERFDLLLKAFKVEDIFISTGKHYSKEVKEILPELQEENFIFEPEMRDTGPAVILAVNYVHSKFPEEVISIQWTDHLIKKPEVFLNALKQSDELLHKSSDRMIFVTVPIRFPSPHRGYIEFEKEVLSNFGENVTLHNFVRFREKPNVETAQDYMDAGNFGWNPGYWIGKGNFFVGKFAQFTPEMQTVCKEVVETKFQDEIKLKAFSALEKISADYAFAEMLEAKDAFALMTDMSWSDIGEWIALKEALEEGRESNVIVGNVFDMNSKNTIVYNNEGGKLIATIGLDGFVVVNTKDVIAIFKQEDNTKLKEYLKLLEEKELKQYL